jgi:hypothetical protein
MDTSRKALIRLLDQVGVAHNNVADSEIRLETAGDCFIVRFEGYAVVDMANMQAAFAPEQQNRSQ